MKQFKFKIRGTEYHVDIKDIKGNDVQIEVNGSLYHVTMERDVVVPKTPTIVRKKLPDAVKNKPLTGTPLKKIVAPLPGNIFKINVKEGDTVKKGDTLLIMEAMKMENNILSEQDGVVQSVKVNEGDAVLQNDVLVEIE